MGTGVTRGGGDRFIVTSRALIGPTLSHTVLTGFYKRTMFVLHVLRVEVAQLVSKLCFCYYKYLIHKIDLRQLELVKFVEYISGLCNVQT